METCDKGVSAGHGCLQEDRTVASIILLAFVKYYIDDCIDATPQA